VRLFNWHKWAGISILVLSAFRLGWRWRHRPPETLVSMTAWQAVLARWTHALMYVMFFLVPVAGWAHSSASGFPVVWFGLLPLPDFVPVDKPLAHALSQVHAALAYTLAAIVVIHVAAALRHHFIERDGLLWRISPLRLHDSMQQKGQ